MNAQRKSMIVAGIALAALAGLAGIIARQAEGKPANAARSSPVYYCPMHPTYTSDRPGDCPICNMRLVKREEQRSAVSGQRSDEGQEIEPRSRKTLKDVCYLHQCPMAHDGKPCPMLVVAKEGEAVTCPVCGTHVTPPGTPASTSTRVLYWTDPMIPGYKSDKPGTSPMGMELVPVYATGGEEPAAGAAPDGYATIAVTPYKQQLIGVRTAPVERRVLTKTIRTVGKVAYDPELYQAQQEYLQSLSGWLEATAATADPHILSQTEQLVESSRTRLRLLGLSEQMITELSSQSGPDRSLLLAEGSGGVWVYAAIYEFELPWVEAGQAVTVELPASPGTAFTGVVRAIDPVLDPATRSVRARVRVDDGQGALKPEMFVNVSIAVTLPEALAVPAEAVFKTGSRQIVFVATGQGMFEPRNVTLGAGADGYEEVRAGVADGEQVVTNGNFLIDSESRLNAALQGMSGGEHQHGR
ncbi:MAG: efflux RND transporter periplasmic adaptor subunit [Candidatus Omnitrophica bacterium]|nr:efflux RND transporter periplasmic adaptor subunit [Candidatus Omnitrophota bacterium]